MRTVNNSRRLQIANYVKQKGEASVQELSEYFAVSPLTVRRDLTALEEQKLLLRYHGGAKALVQSDTANDNGNYEFDLTSVPRVEEKKRIGEKAYAFVTSQRGRR